MSLSQDPQSDDEWREAVNLAEFYLLIDSARKYGLVTGGPSIDVVRCEQILKRGFRRGIRPQKDRVDALVAGLASQ